MIKYLIFALILGTLPQAFAQSAKYAGGKIESYSFNLGSHTEFYNNVQTSDSGDVRKFDFNPTLGFGARLPMWDEFHFLPELNWMMPFFKSRDDVMKNLFMLRADFGYNVLDWLRVRMGTSLMWQNMHGKGGKTTLNNGGSTSTFYYPDENRSSLNNTFDVGAEAFFNKSFSARFQTYTYSLFSEDSRQLSYSVFLTYHWDKENE